MKREPGEKLQKYKIPGRLLRVGSKEGVTASPPPPSPPPFAGWLREPRVALACEAAASAFLFKKKKKKTAEEAKVGGERALLSLLFLSP